MLPSKFYLSDYRTMWFYMYPKFPAIINGLLLVGIFCRSWRMLNLGKFYMYPKFPAFIITTLFGSCIVDHLIKTNNTGTHPKGWATRPKSQ